MPEYLAPGVYVEEIPSGSQPIEGASTSTASMVGMTLRGPVNVPTLVTSFGNYTRVFGTYLNDQLFPDGLDTMPYAAEGFFTNGGSRLFVVRIAGTNATESTLSLAALAANETAGARTLGAAAAANSSNIELADATGVLAGDVLTITDGDRSESLTVAAVNPSLLLAGTLADDYAAGNVVTLQAVTTLAGALQGALAAGATQLEVDNDAGIANNVVLMIRDSGGDRSLDEFVTVSAITPGNPVQIDFSPPLAHAHTATSALSTLTQGGTTVALSASTTSGRDPAILPVPSGAGFAGGSVVHITDGAAASQYAVVSAVQTDPASVNLVAPLKLSHAQNTPVSRTVPKVVVHAISPGAWGDSLRVYTREAAQLQTTLTADATAASDSVTVATAFGLFPGSIISVGGTPAEVASANPVTGMVSLTAPLGAAHIADTAVISQEFSLIVERIENGKAAESETWEKLSLADGHPRNAYVVVGSWNNTTGKPSTSGGSNLIRLAKPAIAVPPAASLLHGLPLFLGAGADDVADVSDTTYIGTPSDDPPGRTGIQALQNEPAISIVAVPGQTSVAVQNALIAHCELMRYRFAVLDTPLGATLAGARSHRQNFDTTRAAVYYPGVVIPNPFGPSGELRTIASSGHMLGVIARTDTTRGVHKAPGNEVVRGILQFETKIGKGEQDILNPLHVNCYPRLPRAEPGPAHLRRARRHVRSRAEIHQRPPPAAIHRTVARHGSPMGRVRAERHAALGYGAAVGQQLPQHRLAVRRASGN